jgi:Family of unknown function (DUF5752)
MPQAKTLKETASVLRDVPPENAFYFYRSLGAPTGAAARNLSDFVGVLSSIDVASIQFHIGRGDFENWLKMLGDDRLAQQITGLKEKKLSGEQLRISLVDTVKTRINQLRKRTI